MIGEVALGGVTECGTFVTVTVMRLAQLLPAPKPVRDWSVSFVPRLP